jgi:CheY-like chemotaxis protein
MIPRTLARPQPPRILVVEDEVLLRSLVAEELRAAGCAVTEVGRADDALAYIDAGGLADLVFSDVRLPGAASGIDLARTLRQRDANLPIFLTSATATAAEMNRDWRFVPKPYNIPKLIAEMFKVLDHRAEDGAP